MHYLGCSERQRHGTDAFPIGFYHVDERHPRYHMPFHWHMEWEIMRIVQGTLHLYLDDGEIAAAAGDLILIGGGVVHGGVPENCVYECAVFDPGALLMHTDGCKRYIRQALNHEIIFPQRISGREFPLLRRLARRLFLGGQSDAAGRELAVLGALYEFFGALFEQSLFESASDAPARSREKMAQIKPVLEYIESAYASPISLEDLSRVAGMSPKYFCRYFQAVIRRTPMDYLNYYRVERACYQLDVSEASVTQVAFDCGFNDASYFIKQFRKYKGTTPKRYRRRTG